MFTSFTRSYNKSNITCLLNQITRFVNVNVQFTMYNKGNIWLNQITRFDNDISNFLSDIFIEYNSRGIWLLTV